MIETPIDYDRHVAQPIRLLAAQMHATGVPVDRQGLEAECQSLQDSVQALQEAVEFEAGRPINVSDSQRLMTFLRDEVGLPIRSGGAAISKALHQNEHRHPILRHVLRLVERTSLLRAARSLLQGIDPVSLRVHPEIEPDRHPAGRFICSNPALDSLSRPLRQYVRTSAGQVLLMGDFAHFELRILAHLARDPELTRLLANPRADLHRTMASRVLKIELEAVTDAQRQLGKQLVFGMINGQTAWGLAAKSGCSAVEARRMIGAFFDAFPGVGNWSRRTREFAIAHGYVTTEFGRRREIRHLRSLDRSRKAAALRQATSHVLQGSAAEHFKIRTLRLRRALASTAHIILPLHDGLLIESGEQELAEVRKAVLSEMQTCLPESGVPLPITVRVGRSWSTASPH